MYTKLYNYVACGINNRNEHIPLYTVGAFTSSSQFSGALYFEQKSCNWPETTLVLPFWEGQLPDLKENPAVLYHLLTTEERRKVSATGMPFT